MSVPIAARIAPTALPPPSSPLGRTLTGRNATSDRSGQFVDLGEEPPQPAADDGQRDVVERRAVLGAQRLEPGELVLLGGEAPVPADPGVEDAVRRLHRTGDLCVVAVAADLGVDQRVGEVDGRADAAGHREPRLPRVRSPAVNGFDGSARARLALAPASAR